MILCSFSPCPDDALLARGATYRKKKKTLSITPLYIGRESLVCFNKRTTWEIRDLGKPLHVLPLPLNDRRTTSLLLGSGRSVRIYGPINRSADLFFYTINRHLVAPPRHRFSDKTPDFPTVRQPIVVEALRPLFLTRNIVRPLPICSSHPFSKRCLYQNNLAPRMPLRRISSFSFVFVFLIRIKTSVFIRYAAPSSSILRLSS